MTTPNEEAADFKWEWAPGDRASQHVAEWSSSEDPEQYDMDMVLSDCQEALALSLAAHRRAEMAEAQFKESLVKRGLTEAKLEKAEALLREVVTDLHESVRKGWVQLAPETQAALDRARAHLEEQRK